MNSTGTVEVHGVDEVYLHDGTGRSGPWWWCPDRSTLAVSGLFPEMKVGDALARLIVSALKVGRSSQRLPYRVTSTAPRTIDIS
jgi:hypothetical protein